MKDLGQLIEALPEIYQPIYGHPELSGARTAAGPRMDALDNTTKLLSAKLKRPLSILDFGSAQGFLEFHLAEAGHGVTGIDFLDKNVALSKAIAKEFDKLDVHFIHGDVLDCESLVNLWDFDLVIGFSVLHHLIHGAGAEQVDKLITRLAETIPVGLFEMALREEGDVESVRSLYWAESLPTNPRITLSPYPFIRKLGTTPTHLTNVERPLFFCSNSLLMLNSQLLDIDSWRDTPHDHVDPMHMGSRRYFFTDDILVKNASTFTEDILPEVVELDIAQLRSANTNLLKLADSTFEVPRVIEFADEGDGALFARDMTPGVLLDEVIAKLSESEQSCVISDVLNQLAQLEILGLYHSDIRTWNVIWDQSKQRARLMDYGSIIDQPRDTVWPFDNAYSFASFVIDVSNGNTSQTGTEHPRYADLNNQFSPQVSSILQALLTHTGYTNLYGDVIKASEKQGELLDQSTFLRQWLEFYGNKYLEESQCRTEERKTAHDNYEIVAEQNRHMQNALNATQHLSGELNKWMERAATLDTELKALRLSTSWRITAPLRQVVSMFKRGSDQR